MDRSASPSPDRIRRPAQRSAARVDIVRAKSIFDRGWRLPVGERARFVESECAGEPELAAVVTRLLRWADSDESRFEPTAAETEPEPEPERLGAYRIGSRRGSGGMGVVYEAWDPRLGERRIAVKVLHPELASPLFLKRFELERRVLAELNHRSIATILDAGVDERQRPWFAMEFVEGVPITSWCERRAIGREARIRLFMEVCSGVEHAHQRGIVHRDLKPANILVAEVDGSAQVRLIDFGIAKALDLESAAHTLFTMNGQVLGTPDYMSPEQADPLDRDVDIRSDVYTLGIVLFELLLGRRPQRFDDVVGSLEALRALREEPVPSLRGIDPAIDRDLDLVCRKALEKDRELRYQSVRAFADDLQRFLRREPVDAAPPSRLHAVRRFVERNRASVTAASLVVFGGLLALVAGGWALWRAENALAVLRAAEREARRVDDPLVADAQLESAGEAWPRPGDLASNVAWVKAWLTRTDDVLDRIPEHRHWLAREADSETRTALAGLLSLEAELVAARAAVAARIPVMARHWPLWDRWRESLAPLPDFAGARLEPMPGLLPVGIDLDRASVGPRNDFPLWLFFAPASGEPPRWVDSQGRPAPFGGPGYAPLEDHTALLLVHIPGGTYQRGAQHLDPAAPGFDPLKQDHADTWEHPVLDLRIAPLLAGKTEVTSFHYLRFVAARRRAPEPPERGDPIGTRTAARRAWMAEHPTIPVAGIELSEAIEFCDWLHLRLPSEAEWEYVCRAGTMTSYWSGSTFEAGREVGWCAPEVKALQPVASRLRPDGSRTPNPWGLYDVHGNAWEWCSDRWRNQYDETLLDGSPFSDLSRTDEPSHPRTHGVRRSGSTGRDPHLMRSANRLNSPPGRAVVSTGLRVFAGSRGER